MPGAVIRTAQLGRLSMAPAGRTSTLAVENKKRSSELSGGNEKAHEQVRLLYLPTVRLLGEILGKWGRGVEST